MRSHRDSAAFKAFEDKERAKYDRACRVYARKNSGSARAMQFQLDRPTVAQETYLLRGPTESEGSLGILQREERASEFKVGSSPVAV